MSDFVSSFWSVYISIVTVVSIVACGVFLWMQSKRRVPGTAKTTTGHTWDENLGEFNNPLPMWWMWLFWITLVFSAIYLALYPGLGSFAGSNGFRYLRQFNEEAIKPRNFAHCGEPCAVACKKFNGEYKKDYEPYAALGPLCGVFDQRAAERLFERIEVGALNILDNSKLECLLVVRLMEDDRHLVQIGELGRPPNVADVGAALARQNKLPGRQPGDDDEAAGMRYILTQLPGGYRPLGVDEVIAAAHRVGGVAVLAHPGRSKGIYAIPATTADIAAMAEAGLDGLEAFYPAHSDEQRAFYRQLARRHHLLVTAGSDSHGPEQPLGQWPAEWCAAFLERMGV